MSAMARDVDAGRPQDLGLRMESEGHRSASLIAYAPDAKLSPAVILLWLCAFIGLGAYVVGLYLPTLALAAKP
jgi:hypothetical protein